MDNAVTFRSRTFRPFLPDDGDEFWLCCSNVDDTDDRWLCFLRTQGKGLFGRSKPSIENAAPLLEALSAVIANEPSIDEVEWSADRY